MYKKYRVVLTAAQRRELLALVSTGQAPAHDHTHARILLQAEAAPAGPGWSDEQIKQLADFETRKDFTAAEKSALRLAERMTRDAHTVDDRLWAELRQHFDEGQIVELAAAVGLFNYFNRFNDALKIEPTK